MDTKPRLRPGTVPRKQGKFSRPLVKNRSHFASLYLFLVLAGAGLATYGYSELETSRMHGTKPTTVTVDELMNGKIRDDRVVRIDSHLRNYPYSCFLYYEDSGATGPDGDSRLKTVYYPVFPLDHPISNGVQALERKYGSLENAPPEEFPPSFDGYLVLVKTDDFDRLRNIPGHTETADSLEGTLVQNPRWTLKQSNLLRKAFPEIGISRILLLDKDKRPISPFASYLMLGVGICLLVLPLGLMVAKRRQRARPIPRARGVRR
tara:strand:- start:175 stop:963 length:789 start_codon:yes stop_codon:yes gene_type:complete